MDIAAQQINLYNPALRRVREWLTLTNVAMLGALFAVILFAVGFVLHQQANAKRVAVQALEAKLTVVRIETTQLAARLAGNTDSLAAGRELADLKQQVMMRSEVLAALQAGAGMGSIRGQSNMGFVDYLRALARQTVNGLWLTGFSVAQGGSGIEVRGRMLVVDRLPEYIRRLNGEASFKGRQFVSLNISRSDKANVALGGTPHAAFVLTAMPEPKELVKGKEAIR